MSETCPQCGCVCAACVSRPRPPWLRRKAKLRTRDVLIRITKGGSRRGAATSPEVSKMFGVPLFDASRRLRTLEASRMLRREGKRGRAHVYTATEWGMAKAKEWASTA